jgi:pimeloyl-ACP methyl ester carboxylesterase
MNRLGVLALVLAALVAVHSASADMAPVVKDLAFSGTTERVLLLSPDHPKATVVLFPGGDGVVRLETDGSIGAATNFLVRSREHWVELGYAVLLPDVPMDLSNLMGNRITESYAAAVAALVDFAKQENHAPVWLIGTSQGTNAAVNAASRMTHGEIAGIILTSTVTHPGKGSDLKETVFDADLAAINVPALIVSHTDDACKLSPPSDAERLQAALTGSPRTKVILISGGEPPVSGACEAKSPHGFYGVEVEAIKDMASWIAGN